jgi:hypothetical protein
MRHFPTLQTLLPNRSLNYGRKPKESPQFGFKLVSHHLPALQSQREVAHRRGGGVYTDHIGDTSVRAHG